MLCMLLFCFAVGCTDPVNKKAMPAPLSEEKNYSLTGRVRLLWGGDNFEFGRTEQLRLVLIRGVDTPKEGQPFFLIARSVGYQLMIRNKVRIEVVDRDELKCEIADVFVVNEDPADIAGDLNVGLELIRRGLGWYDGTEFELAEEYREAEAAAREQRLGLWADENPIPPWEFYEKKQQDMEARLDESAKRIEAEFADETGASSLNDD